MLALSFVSAGTQLLSTGSDGLLKLWSVKTSECLNTFDEHEDKVWALAAADDGATVYTGTFKESCIHRSGPLEQLAPFACPLWTTFQKRVADARCGWAGAAWAGGADGRINVWADSTAEVTEQTHAAAETVLLQQQQLESAVRGRKWGKAIELALGLQMPSRLRSALSACLQVREVFLCPQHTASGRERESSSNDAVEYARRLLAAQFGLSLH